MKVDVANMPIYDITYGKFKGSPVIKVLTIKDGKKHKLFLEFPVRPFFYAIADAVTEKQVKAILPDANVVDDGAIAYDGRKVLKVETTEPSEVALLRDILGRENCMEADVPYARRVLIEKGWTITPPAKELKAYVDIETDSSKGMPSEKKADARVLSVAISGGDDKDRVWFLEKETDDSEKELLKRFIDWANRYVMIGTWYGHTFDWPYLFNRCKRLGIFFPYKNWVHVDLVVVYRDVLLRSPPHNLDDVAMKELGESKLDINRNRIYELYKEDPLGLGEYNLRDVKLTRKLDEKLHMSDLIFEIAKISHCPAPHFFKRARRED